MPVEDPKSERRLRLVVYAGTGIILLFAVVDWVMIIWPMSPGEITWRYGAAGLASSSLYMPILATVGAYAVATTTRHRLAVRLIALLALTLAVSLWGLIGAFSLDFTSLRGMTGPEEDRTGFYQAFAHASTRLLLSALFFSMMGVLGWTSAKGGSSGHTRPAGPGVIRATADG